MITVFETEVLSCLKSDFLASELVTEAPSDNQHDANLSVQTPIFLGLLCQTVEVI